MRTGSKDDVQPPPMLNDLPPRPPGDPPPELRPQTPNAAPSFERLPSSILARPRSPAPNLSRPRSPAPPAPLPATGFTKASTLQPPRTQAYVQVGTSASSEESFGKPQDPGAIITKEFQKSATALSPRPTSPRPQNFKKASTAQTVSFKRASDPSASSSLNPNWLDEFGEVPKRSDSAPNLELDAEEARQGKRATFTQARSSSVDTDKRKFESQVSTVSKASRVSKSRTSGVVKIQSLAGGGQTRRAKRMAVTLQTMQNKGSAMSSLRLRLIGFVGSPIVEGFFMLLVFTNAITMALESEMPESKDTFSTMDQVFLVLYTVELLLRFSAFRSLALRGYANQLDITIVTVGWLQLIFASIAAAAKIVNALKVLRACRILRCLRMLSAFEGLWIVLESFLYCLVPMAWVCVFMAVLIYTFSIFCVELIGTSPDFDNVETQIYFKTTTKAFVTLFQIMTLDEWRAIIQPVCDHRGWAYILFFVYISLSALTLMNLLTAVVVEKSVKRFDLDEEWQNRLLERSWQVEIRKIEELLNYFRCENGELADEMVINPEDLMSVRSAWSALENTLKGLGMDSEEDIKQLFMLLDADDSGELEFNEVIDGLLQLRIVSEDHCRAAIIQTVPGDMKFDLLGRFTNQLPETNVRRLTELEERLAVVLASLSLAGPTVLALPPLNGGDSSINDIQEEAPAASSDEVPPSIYGSWHSSGSSETCSYGVKKQPSVEEEIIKEMRTFREEITSELQRQSLELARQDKELNELWNNLGESLSSRYGIARVGPPPQISRDASAPVYTRQEIEEELFVPLSDLGAENRNASKHSTIA